MQLPNILERTLDHLTHAFREVVNVVCVQPSHRDATISSHVDMRLLSKLLRLRLRQTSKAIQIR